MTSAWIRAVCFLTSTSILLVPAAAPAAAQSWEIEVHGGGMLGNNPTSGQASLPETGVPFTTGGGRPSRREPSWYFGDGPSLLNEVNAALRAAGRIVSLDPVLRSPVLERGGGGGLGVRIGRRLGARLTAEIAFDLDLARLRMSNESLAGIEASRASFITAWNDLLARPSFVVQSVTSAATLRERGGRQFFTTGALNIDLRKEGKLTPYVTVGAGFVSRRADALAATLAGSYQFRAVAPGATLSFNESDNVTLRYSTEGSFVGVLGAGFKYYASRRWGVRADIRGHLGRNNTDSLLEANPVAASLTPPASLTLTAGSAPTLQFINNPVLARQSTLSGPPISGFQTFKGSGLQSRVGITAGVFLRF